MQLEQPLFTVATITYNSGKWVKQTIESILSSSYENFELIISDDCSTDDTWEIIQQYKDPRIRSWRNESNMGEYPNRNKVLHAAKGEYILYIDGDDILYKNTLKVVSDYVDHFPDAGIICGVLIPLNKYAILPFEFKPEQSIKLLYDNSNLISVVGFAETLFNVKKLKHLGGLSNDFSMGDIYIRKKMMLQFPTLLVPFGMTYWRESENQASKKLKYNHRDVWEAMLIDWEIIKDPKLPLKPNEKLLLERFIIGSFIRRIILQYLFKFRILIFYKILRQAKVQLKHLPYVFYKVNYRRDFSIKVDIQFPLFNNYHFQK